MKIEITIEVDDTQVPPPDAIWDPRPDHGARVLREIVSWAEKTHYHWNRATVIGDGDVAWEWELGRATPKEIEEMRREVVAVAAGRKTVYSRVAKDRLGEDYKAVVEEYEADPEAPWVRKLEKSFKAAERRQEKVKEKQEAEAAQYVAMEETKQKLMRELIKDEDFRQKVEESQGGERLSRHRIRVMVEARVTGLAAEDPTPKTPAEEVVWGRLCRAIEAQASFKLPTRFNLNVSDPRSGRYVSFNF